MRYVVALAVAALLIGCVTGYAFSLHRAVIAELRAEIQKLPDQDQTPESFLHQYDRGQFPYEWGPHVPSSVQWKLEIIDLLATFWPQWASLIIGGCILMAWFISPPHHPRPMPASPANHSLRDADSAGRH